VNASFCRLPLPAALTIAAFFPALACAEDILQPGSKVEKIAEGCKFTEGPAVDREGDLYFSDGPNDRILRRTPDGKVSVFHSPCGRANGLAIDAEGRLVMCQSAGEGGKRRVARREKDGKETVLAETYDGKPFIAPNDLTIDKEGRIYFSDPYYGPPAEKSQPVSGVYRIDAPGKVVRVIEDLQRPNGILLTPDNQLLYVSDRGTQKLHRYEVQEDGGLKAAGVIYDFSPDRGIDGLALDEEGNIYGAAGEGKTTGLFVISPDGKLLLHQPMPEFSTNTEFGGADGRELFLTAGGSVYRLRTVVRGARTPGGPKWEK
jgi:gluconolactonase